MFTWRWFPLSGLSLSTILILSVTAHAEDAFTLSWPIACELGRTCFVQNYVDHDASDAAKDFRCGSRTYDKHDGTDIRLTDALAQEEGVDVLAAAAGRVLRTRDGVSDVSIRVTGRAAIAGKECGNGLVIDHGNGWSTQYCHLQNGSIAVVPNEIVKDGAVLGRVGLSGETEVPHLHLTVRHDGTVVDPFAYGEPAGACSGGRSLWANGASKSFQYNQREIINMGFAREVATMENIESGRLRQQAPDRWSDQLVAYVRAIGLQKGDVQILSVQFPDGQLLGENHMDALDANKAEFFVSAGRRRTGAEWPKGSYQATYRVLNNGGLSVTRTFKIDID